MKPSDEQVWAAYLKADGNAAAASRDLGVKERWVQEKVQFLKQYSERLPAREDDGVPLVRFPDKKVPNDDWRTILKRGTLEAKAREEADPSQTSGLIDLSKVKTPIGVFLISDVHFGSPQCDYEAFLRHVALLDSIPNLYAIIQGDVLEWAISPRMMDATLGQVFPPAQQARVVRGLMADMSRKILAAIMGNHEGRVEKFSGFDLGEFLYAELRKNNAGVYMRDGGSLTISLGGERYTWRVTHGDSRFGSFYNPNHKSMQLARMAQGVHDVVSTGHTHSAAIQQMEVPGQDGSPQRKITSLQAGSYKIMQPEQYPDRLGFGRALTVDMPGVIFFPGEHVVMPFLRVEDLARVLVAFNKKAA